MRGSGRWTVAAMAVMLTLAGVYVGLLATAPFDGVTVGAQGAAWRADGVRVVAVGSPSPIRTGDVVVAVEGVPLRGWPAHAMHERPGLGDSVTYTVVRDGDPLDVMVTLTRYPFGAQLGRYAGLILFGLALAVMGIYLHARRRQEATAALVMLGVGMFSSVVPFALGVPVLAVAQSSAAVWLYLATTGVVYMVAWSGALVFVLWFPEPHPLLVRQRWLAAAIYAAFVGGTTLAFVVAPLSSAPLRSIALSFWTQPALILAMHVLEITLMTRSYRRTRDPIAKQQLRWVAGGGLASVVLSGLIWLGPEAVTGRPLLPWSAGGIGGLPLIVGLAVAVLRYRLFDLDRVISRALSYAILTVLVGGVYVVAVGVLRRLLDPVAGRSQLAVAGSTLAVAMLFGPARRRVQAAVDRQFNRARYDAAKTVDGFASRLRDPVDLDQISAELLAAVHSTVQPSRASLWLRQAPRGAPRGQTPR